MHRRLSVHAGAFNGSWAEGMPSLKSLFLFSNRFSGEHL